uniref:Cytosolic fatty-acid binding proteins domain-containing protein n=1 Tax=Panagrolaimus superbus TaxID=310955 RepID=A0A914Z729_9BILA
MLYSKILSVFVLILAVSTVEASPLNKIPEKFLGKFKLEKSENFDAYLKSKGLPWVLRKIICAAPVTYVFKQGNEEGTYTDVIISYTTTTYPNWKIDGTFEGEGMDGTTHRITFSMPDENTLTEHHDEYQIESADNQELYHWTREGDYLVQTMSNKGITAKRWHKLVQEKN